MVTISFRLKGLNSLCIYSLGSHEFLKSIILWIFPYFVKLVLVFALIIDIHIAGGIQRWHSILFLVILDEHKVLKWLTIICSA